MKSLHLSDTLAVALSNPAKFLPVAGNRDLRKKFGETLRAKLAGVQYFFLDDDFTRTASWLGIQHPEILLAGLSRARAPYGKTWIEWPKIPQMEGANEPLLKDAPELVGVLIERLDEQEPFYSIYIFSKPSNAENDHQIVCMPLRISYHLKDVISELHPKEENELLERATVSQKFAKACLVGSAYQRCAEEQDEEVKAYRSAAIDNLTQHGMYSISPFFRPYLASVQERNYLRSSITETSGTWRMVIAILMLMNSHDYAQTDFQNREPSKFVNGKKIVFNQHITVRLKLPSAIVKDRVIRDLGASIPKPQRSVRGSWRTNTRWFPGKPGCEHVFVSETSMREACVVEGCNYKKWWVNDYTRGNPEYGVITKDYAVTE